MPRQAQTKSHRLIYFVAGAPNAAAWQAILILDFNSEILRELVTNVRVASLRFICSSVRLISKKQYGANEGEAA